MHAFGKLNRTRNQLNASLTQNINNHVLKFGTEIEHSDVRDRYAFPGEKFFIDNERPEEDPSSGEDDFFTLTYIGDGYEAHGTNNRISLFAQDSWQITPGFTLILEFD